MRIAWFSPLPPHRSGIAAYSAEILGRLNHHEVDAFIDDGSGTEAVARTLPLPGVHLRGAHDFPWRHASRPYDAIVYQLGNDICHEYLWPYMVRYPGLVVLHDAQLHQSRAQGLLRQARPDDYRAEFRYSHPDVDPAIAELVVTGLGGKLFHLWPLVRVPIEAARLVVVHSPWLARTLADEYPGQEFALVRQGVPGVTAVGPGPAAEVRRRHAIRDDAVVFASFGRVTPEKGLTHVLLAMGQVADAVPRAHLMVVGDAPRYFDLAQQARALGVADRLTLTGYVDESELPDYLAAADVCLNLRWPTNRETSAAWLRCLAAGKPTVITDLAHLGDVPSLDLRSMKLVCTVPGADEAVCVSVELIDEIHMLRLALRRLTEDAPLRSRLGSAARRYWAAHATLDLMARDYEAALTRVAAMPSRPLPMNWPAHLAADGSATALSIADALGVRLDWLGREARRG